MDLYSDIIEIKGIGDKTAKYFKKLNIETVRDLIFYIPKGFALFEAPVIPTSESRNSPREVTFCPLQISKWICF